MNKSKPGKLLVVGSYNRDLVSITKKLPKPGETVLGKRFFTTHGGKGANQAVAAAKLGLDTTLLTKIGTDSFGNEALSYFKECGINTDFVLIDKKVDTGTAQIIVDESAENTIVVSPGANFSLSPEDIIQNEEIFSDVDAVLIQFEIPIDTVKEVIKAAKKYNKIVIVNPAPAIPLEEEWLKKIDYLTPNKSELATLTNTDELKTLEEITMSTRELLKKGVKNIIVTLGGEGGLYLNNNNVYHLPAFSVKSVDTSGAGDCFNGAFAHHLLNNNSILKSLKYASAAASLSVMKHGTSNSYPNIEKLESFMADNDIEISHLCK